jgi:hypothetical protein
MYDPTHWNTSRYNDTCIFKKIYKILKYSLRPKTTGLVLYENNLYLFDTYVSRESRDGGSSEMEEVFHFRSSVLVFLANDHFFFENKRMFKCNHVKLVGSV